MIIIFFCVEKVEEKTTTTITNILTKLRNNSHGQKSVSNRIYLLFVYVVSMWFTCNVEKKNCRMHFQSNLHEINKEKE